MSVLTRSFKQTNGYFVPLAPAVGKIFTYTAGTGAGGSYVPGSFAAANWASATPTGLSTVSTLLSGVPGNGTLLKDMGKTVVSANRTFRKIQLVVPGLSSFSTSGVSSEPSNASAYYTGYIELAGPNAFSSGVSAALPVAYLPGLL